MRRAIIYVLVFTIVSVFSKGSQVKQWQFTDDTSRQTCILVQFIARLNITYPTEDGKVSRAVYNVPVNDSQIISGSCGDGDDESDPSIIIEWTDSNLVNTMDLLFKFYPETHLYSLNAITFDINASILPNGIAQMSKYFYVSGDFWAPEGWSFHCDKWQTVKLTSENKHYVMGTVDLANIKFEASLKDDIVGFSMPFECRIDDLTRSTNCTELIFNGIHFNV